MNDRELWLLSEVSSMGRATIDVGQYEELRELARALKSRVAELEYAAGVALRFHPNSNGGSVEMLRKALNR
jgi:hypothetical protein